MKDMINIKLLILESVVYEEDYVKFLSLPALCLSLSHLHLNVFHSFPFFSVMTMRFGPKVNATTDA